MVENSMQNWKTMLTSAGKELAEVHIRRGIFQGDSLSPLLFVICLIPISLMLRKAKAEYSFGNDKSKVNYLLFMDDMKLFGTSSVEIDKLVSTVYLVSADMRMEFGIRKCGVLVLKKVKVIDSDGVQLSNGERMQSVDEEGYKYLGILEVDDLQHTVIKERFCAEYFRRLKKVLSSKLNGRNVIRAINAWVVAVMRYGAGVVNWTQTELQAIDRKTRKKLSMYGAMHVRDSVDKLYCSRREGGRGLSGVCACVKAEENGLGYYVSQTLEPVLQEVGRQKIVNVVQCIEPSDYKEAEKLKGMQNWNAEFVRDTEPVSDKEKSWGWLRNGDLKKEIEGMILAAQGQGLRINYVKFRMDHDCVSRKCRMCDDKNETMWHVIGECSKLAGTEYKRRHDNVARIIHRALCIKYGFSTAERWYEHNPGKVLESREVKILWDFSVQADHETEARKPDITVIDKTSRECHFIEITCPLDWSILERENFKVDKYQDLKREVAKLWNARPVVLPLVVGALGMVTNRLEGFIRKIGVDVSVGLLQKACLLGTTRILRRVLEA